MAPKTPQSLFLISSNASICVDDSISHTSKAKPNITFLCLDNEEEQLVSSRAPFLWAERRNMHLFVETWSTELCRISIPEIPQFSRHRGSPNKLLRLVLWDGCYEGLSHPILNTSECGLPTHVFLTTSKKWCVLRGSCSFQCLLFNEFPSCKFLCFWSFRILKQIRLYFWDTWLGTCPLKV